MQQSQPTPAPMTAAQRRRIVWTAVALALLALGFYLSAFFKPWP
jgi:predicted secreted protein